ncbi:hypothetical protein SDC9_103712 [bioreactor metagenome]|uniref:Uncharacterized protein n=1 Tax=bioreactor metagenome TaxID=1076179 RepID=A0A645AUG7_9ZZZZ
MLIRLELRLQRLPEAHGLGRDDVLQRAALGAGEHGGVDLLIEFVVVAKNHAAPGTPQSLVGGGGHNVGIGNGRGMDACGHKARDVRHVHHQIRAHRICNLPELLEVDGPGVGGGARDDQFGLALLRGLHQLVIINLLSLLIQTVGDDIKIFAGDVHGTAVAQMSAVGQIHTHHGITGLYQRKKRGQVRIGAGVRLDVGMIAAKQLAGPLAGDLLGHVHSVASAVIPVAGIALGVLVGQAGAHGQHDRLADDILAGNQFDVPALTGEFLFDGRSHLGIKLGNKVHGLVHHNKSLLCLCIYPHAKSQPSLFYRFRKNSSIISL